MKTLPLSPDLLFIYFLFIYLFIYLFLVAIKCNIYLIICVYFGLWSDVVVLGVTSGHVESVVGWLFLKIFRLVFLTLQDEGIDTSLLS